MNLHVSLRQSTTQRTFIQLENISSNLSVAELKKEIALKAGLDPNACLMGWYNVFCFILCRVRAGNKMENSMKSFWRFPTLELVYSCRSMKDDSTLEMLEEGNTVKLIYANIVKPGI